MELCSGSGGWGEPKSSNKLPPVQLYDLSKDIGEQTKEEASHLENVARLTKLLEKYLKDGRSTPGPNAKNDIAIDIDKTNGSKMNES